MKLVSLKTNHIGEINNFYYFNGLSLWDLATTSLNNYLPRPVCWLPSSLLFGQETGQGRYKGESVRAQPYLYRGGLSGINL